MTITLNAGWNLVNAKALALASQDAYTKTPTMLCPADGTALIITECDARSGEYGLAAEPGGCVVIVFEGSRNPRQFITDVEAWKHNIKDVSVHAGFYKVIASVMVQIVESLKSLDGEKKKPIIITGHSLGGALAQLCAYELDVAGFIVDSVYTFGGPRVANSVGVLDYGKLSDRTYRVVNGADIVPWCPGYLYGYRHTQCEMYMPATGGVIGHPALIFKSLGNAVEIWREWRRGGLALLTDHFIDSYLGQLGKLS